MRPRRYAAVAVAVAGLFLVAVASFALTAANSVPASQAGSTSSSRTVAQLTPAQCSSNGVNPTNLVVGSGSTVTGTSASDLILGPNLSGTITLRGNGGGDCIVGGGGPGTTNVFQGGSGADVCIGAPGAVNTFNSCAKTF